jgi:hypothetical protein
LYSIGLILGEINEHSDIFCTTFLPIFFPRRFSLAPKELPLLSLAEKEKFQNEKPRKKKLRTSLGPTLEDKKKHQ